MFKRTLACAAVLSAMAAHAEITITHGGQTSVASSSFSLASATTANGTPVTYSNQGLNSASSVDMPAIRLQAGTSYPSGSTFTVDFNAPLWSALDLDDITTDVSGTAVVKSGIDAVEGTITLSVTEDTVAGDMILVRGISLSKAEAQALNGVTVAATSSALVAGDQVASETGAASTVAKFEDQFDFAVATKLNDTISTDLVSFTNGPDTLVLTVSDTTSLANAATGTSLTLSLTSTGGWSFVDSSSTAGIQDTSSVVTVANEGEISFADSVATIESALVTSTASNTITINPAVGLGANKIVPVSVYKVSATINYTDIIDGDASVSFDAVDAGNHDQAGSLYSIPAMPVSTNVSPFLWATNSSSSDAALSFTLVTGGKSYGPYSAGVVEGQSTKRFASEYLNALEDAGVTSGRVEIRVVASVESNDFAGQGSQILAGASGTQTLFLATPDVKIYAGYEQTVDNDRLNLDVHKAQ